LRLRYADRRGRQAGPCSEPAGHAQLRADQARIMAEVAALRDSLSRN